MIPKALSEVVEVIKTSNLKLPIGLGGAWQDSLASERKIVEFLLNQGKWEIRVPSIESGNTRHWYDLSIDGHLCDIKVTDLSGGPSNTNAKKAIYYFLTGDMNVPWKTQQYFQKLSSKLQPDEKRDFYYLVVKKPKADDAFVVSLKGITNIKPSHSNQPFQCDFSLYDKPEERTWSDAKDFLLGAWAESVSDAIDSLYNGLPAHFPEYFGGLNPKDLKPKGKSS